MKKILNSAEVPLLALLPGNVAEPKVIFITNEINNAAICIRLGPEGLRRLRGMRILWRNSPTAKREVIRWNRLEIRGLKWIWMHFHSIYLHNARAQTEVIMWKQKSRKIWRLRALTQQLNKAQKPFSRQQKTCSKAAKEEGWRGRGRDW